MTVSPRPVASKVANLRSATTKSRDLYRRPALSLPSRQANEDEVDYADMFNISSTSATTERDRAMETHLRALCKMFLDRALKTEPRVSAIRSSRRTQLSDNHPADHLHNCQKLRSTPAFRDLKGTHTTNEISATG